VKQNTGGIPLEMGGSSEHKPLTDIEVNAIVVLASFPGRVGTRQLLPGKQHFKVDMGWLS